MNLKRMETLITLVESGSFSHTATILKMTQPAISQQLKLLEKEMGATLLNRESFQLSRTGEILYEKGKKITQFIAEMEAEIQMVQNHVGGLMKIGASTVPSVHLIPQLLNQMGKKYPSLHFHLQVADTMNMIEQVKEEKCQMGIVGSNEVDCSTLACTPIYTDRFVIVAPTRWRVGSSISEIQQMPFIFREKTSGTQRELEELLGSENIDVNQLKCVATVQNTEAAIAFVENEIGISIISKLSGLRAIATNRIQVLHTFNPPRQFSLIYKKKYEHDPTLLALKAECVHLWAD